VAESPAVAEEFNRLGLRSELVQALAELGYEEPTPIQREAIPLLLQGRDLMGQAATGTGKTAAFALPILQRLPDADRGRAPRALVLVPTRELAIQVSEAVHRYGRDMRARVLPIYGGQPIVRQLRALSSGVDVVVGTPGRVLDHLHRGSLTLAQVETVVLDEADEMLDMGFADDLAAIMAASPAGRQTLLFSATIPARVQKLARRYLRNPVSVQVGHGPSTPGGAPLVRQTAYVVTRAHKPATLGRILDVESPTAAIVFCRTRDEVDRLTETLNGRGYRAEALHGGMTQDQRDRVMGRLRAGTAELLVATDVAARGLDIDQLTHVINYDVPTDPESYVHRIGRVGRAGRSGVAITLAEPREHRMLKAIERATRQRMHLESVPTVADLRARRLESTRAAIHENLLAGDLDGFRVVVETLAAEFDVLEVALAAVQLAHESTGGSAAEEEDIPAAAESTGSGGRTFTEPTARLFVGAGRSAGVRPQDLVGAIAGESRLTGRDIGSIEISDRFSLVEIPDSAMAEVLQALRGTMIKGKKAVIRRDRVPAKRPRAQS